MKVAKQIYTKSFSLHMPNQIWFQLKQSQVFSHQHSFWCSRRRTPQLQWEVQLLRDDSPGFSKVFIYATVKKSEKQSSFWSLQKLRMDWLIWLSPSIHDFIQLKYVCIHILIYKYIITCKYTLVCPLLCSPELIFFGTSKKFRGASGVSWPWASTVSWARRRQAVVCRVIHV